MSNCCAAAMLVDSRYCLPELHAVKNDSTCWKPRKASTVGLDPMGFYTWQWNESCFRKQRISHGNVKGKQSNGIWLEKNATNYFSGVINFLAWNGSCGASSFLKTR